MVHLKVTLASAAKPITVLVGDEGVVTAAPFAAPIMVHVPDAVTGEGAFAANVKLAALHSAWSIPAFAATGASSFLSTTSSNVEHEPLEMVHLSVTLNPGSRPVTVVFAKLILVIEAPLAAA